MEFNQQMNSSNSNSRPPLHNACLAGNEDAVLSLISKRAVDLEEVDFTGCTAVQLASAGGHINIVKNLITNGANIEKRDTTHGNSSLHEVAWRGFSNLVKILSNPKTVNQQNNSGFTPLHLSCQAGHNQSTRELLVAGSNPNIVNTYGDTALHTAVRYGHAGVTRILLSARALSSVQNKNGDSPLHIASAMGRKKLAQILLSAGCNSELKNHQHETALDISLRKGYAEVTEAIKNPPEIITPIERDQMRASKYKSITSSGTGNSGRILGRVAERAAAVLNGNATTSVQVHDRRKSYCSTGKERTSSNNNSRRGSASNLKILMEHERKSAGAKSSNSNIANNDVPMWSPYGCHFHPNPGAFPPPNIDSLPSEPLSTGELYYLDLAGNIKKGPMGVKEGCYCGLNANQISQSMVALGPQVEPERIKPSKSTPRSKPAKVEIREPQPVKAPMPKKSKQRPCEDQLRNLTDQLSKIHMDTQAQLSSLQSMLNERLKSSDEPPFNESRLKDWVKQYRRFRKELSKNPKALHQANELLASASNLLSTRVSPPPSDHSETDSGL